MGKSFAHCHHPCHRRGILFSWRSTTNFYKISSPCLDWHPYNFHIFQFSSRRNVRLLSKSCTRDDFGINLLLHRKPLVCSHCASGKQWLSSGCCISIST